MCVGWRKYSVVRLGFSSSVVEIMFGSVSVIIGFK